MPSVSVLMPAYNAKNTIRQAVTSLLRQTFTNFEIVVVDDGSTDGTGDILDELSAEDPRIRVVHIPHSGLVIALNAGLAECRGEFIARMDADDYCHPKRLSLQVEYMKANSDISVCGCLVRSFPRNSVRGGFLQYEKWLNSLISHDDIARDIFVESPMAHPSVMVRAGELRELGGYRDMGWPEDYDLWMRYFIAGKRFGKVPNTMLFWREHADRLTFTDSRYSLENFLRLKAHFLAKMLAGSTRPVVIGGVSVIGRRLIKHLTRAGVQPVAVVEVDSNKIGQKIRGTPIIPPEEFDQYPNNTFVIAAVGTEGARETIRAYLRKMGRIEGVDFVCAA